MKSTILTAAALTPFGASSVIPGQVYLANEDRIVESTFSQPLTEYATGWVDNNPLQAHLQSIAPEVEAGERFDFRKFDNSEAFLSELDDVRAPMADFKRVEYTGQEQTERLDNKGLTIRVEKNAISEASRQRKIRMLTQRLLRNELRRASTILQAITASTGKTWNGTTDPDADLITGVQASADGSGIMPNVVVFDASAWAMRQIALRASDKAGAFASASMTPVDLAGLLGVEKVIILPERFTTKRGQGTKQKVLNGGVIIANIDENAMEDDPSNMKRFIKAGGMRVHVDDSHAKFEDITVEHYSKIIAPSSVGVVHYLPSAS